MQKDLLDFLHLYHCFDGSRARLYRLLQDFDGSARRILQSSAADLREHGVDRRSAARILQVPGPGVDADLAWAETAGNHLVCYPDAAYPPLLRQISDPPLLLYVRGNPEVLLAPQIAIVGSRNCTPGGAQNARDFAMQCGAAGLAVTSGLAHGIDAAAHRGAIEIGAATIAVLGTGVNRVYPSRNRKLADEILQQGAMISEFALDSVARPANFPQRNRIISGLAIATLVVEAAERSGSLITARLAAEQGREVMAVPGSIHNPQARGCHRLIRDGAALVEDAQDIAAELGGLLEFARRQAAPADARCAALDTAHRQLLERIGYDPVHCDLLVERSGLTMDKLSSMLVTLELNDLIQSAPGGCYVRI